MWVATVGMTAEDFGAEAARFAVGHAGPRSARVMSSLVERLEEHRRRGDRVVVATGCASPTWSNASPGHLRRLRRALGDDVDVIPTT